MRYLTSDSIESTKKTISYKLNSYYRQKKMYQAVIWQVKKEVKSAIATKFRKDEEEINAIVSKTKREEELKIFSIVEIALLNIRGENHKAPDNKSVTKPKSESKKLVATEVPERKDKDNYSVKEAAQYLRIGESTFRKYQAEEKIVGSKVGSKWIFTKEQLEKVKTMPKTKVQNDKEVEDAIIK